jgi:hypothetical protein
LAGGFACLLCVVLGTGLVVVSPAGTTPAKARPQNLSTAPELDAEMMASLSAANAAAGLDSAVDDAYDFTAAVRKKAATGASGAVGDTGAADQGAAGTPESEPLIPEDVPGTGVHVDPDGAGVGPQPPEVPDTPETKTGLEHTVEEVVETTDELLDGVRTTL